MENNILKGSIMERGLGEDGILAILNRRFRHLGGPWPDGAVGPGDDAAVVQATERRFVITVDAMSQDRDFRLRWPSGIIDNGYSTGWKAAAQNLSDLNSMGARASALLISLELPEWTPVAWIDRCAQGIVQSATYLGAHQCRIAGGDLSLDSRLGVTITATGDLVSPYPILRRAQLCSDVQDSVSKQKKTPCEFRLVHYGSPGWAAAGLAVLETPRDRLTAAMEKMPGVGRLMAQAVRAQLRPRPPLLEGPRVASQIQAMMDVSDGLFRDGQRLAEANDSTAHFDSGWLELAATVLHPLASVLGADAMQWVSTGGEDYGLLGLQCQHRPVPQGWDVVGQLRPAKTPLDVGSEKGGSAGTQGGWDHFS